ncbi:Cell division control protein 7 [Bulinus truncatus]|nr:Cell division control protein 7 [Bulinus truncatus]
MDDDEGSQTEELADHNIIEKENDTFAKTPKDKSFSDDEEINHPKDSPDKLASVPKHLYEIDEIDALYCAVPEVANHFSITCKIGEGAFSCVYLAKLKHYSEVKEMFALKHIIPTTHPSRIQNELTCLLKIDGCDNVMDVKLCFRHRDHVVFVMPVFYHDKFQDYLHNFSVEETREYMRNLLIALRRVHQFEIIHRDVKPSNFLYNRQQKRFSLVDFGLASGPMLIDRDADKHRKVASAHSNKISATENKDIRVALSPSKLDPACSNGNIVKPKNPISGKVDVGKRRSSIPGKTFTLGLPSTSAASVLADFPGRCDCFGKPQICSTCVSRQCQVAPRAGTAGFRAPEVLMKFTEQGTAVDIWSAGVILLSILSARYPFFRAQDDMGYLTQIIAILGSEACVKAAAAIGKNLVVSESVEPVDLKTACTRLRLSQMSYKLRPDSQSHKAIQSWETISDEPFDLLMKMLDPNPHTRITAEAALNHPFFKKTTS